MLKVDIFFEFELRVQKPLKHGLSGMLMILILNFGVLPLPKEIVSHFEALMGSLLQENKLSFRLGIDHFVS